MKKREFELTEIIGKLVNHVKALRALRINNIDDALGVEGRKNKLEFANDKLSKEILKLNRLVAKLKEKQKKETI